MGQTPSSFGVPGQRRSFRGFVRRSKRNKSNLSHTFSMSTSDEYPELVNINTASEEQLMTLPGVTRPLAQAIVQHRQLIGRFKRVDDLALVSGIGADKLQRMRSEICVNKKVLSRTSSCTQSLDSVRTNIDNSKLCSVNSASVFQLQCVPGLNQEIAANIVSYREKKGPFKSLDDLIKVRGMDILRLGNIKPHLSLERKCESLQQLVNSIQHNGTNSEFTSTPMNGFQNRTPHRKSLSMPTKFPLVLPNGFAAAPINDILDLLSAYSHRPIIEEDFQFVRNGVRCCRIASWNLDHLNVDKIQNPGVREVICRTILENRISILAVQDVVDEEALSILCEELNCPGLRRVREWKSNSHRWQYCVSSEDISPGLGFLYDASCRGISVECLRAETLARPGAKDAGRETLDALEHVQKATSLVVSPQLFRICKKQLLVLNVYGVKALNSDDVEMVDRLMEANGRSGLPATIAGYFLHADDGTGLSAKCNQVITDNPHSTLEAKGGRSEILTSGNPDADQFNGVSGVVRVGLCHLAIPRGWSWGGPVSPHCPLWAEFNID